MQKKQILGDRVLIDLPVTKPVLTNKLIHPSNGLYRIIEKTSPVHCKVKSCIPKEDRKRYLQTE